MAAWDAVASGDAPRHWLGPSVSGWTANVHGVCAVTIQRRHMTSGGFPKRHTPATYCQAPFGRRIQRREGVQDEAVRDD